MKLIHLSDLHIGKRVKELPMLDEQEYILTRILQIVDEEKVDAVLIAGDVYDKSVPSAEAVTLFDDFLCRLAKRNMPTFIISGNHDSPERLAFGGRLFQSRGIHISPVYNGEVQPITLSDEYGPVHFWLLPFVKPIHVKRFFPDDGIESYTDAVRVAIRHMAPDPSARNVLLTHQFVTGASVDPDGSEELSVGGSDNVDASVFEPFDYVALGHIHSPQNIGSNKIRYCGTPLKYSFAEVAHYKSVTVVELGGKDTLALHAIPLTPRHDMRQIRGTFAELTDKAFYSACDTADYLHIILTDEEDVPEAIGRLRVIYPNLLQLSYDNTRTRTTQIIGRAEDAKSKTPLQLFEELYETQNNQPMSSDQRTYVMDLIEKLMEERA